MPRNELEQHRQSFAENGFTIIRDVVPRDALSQLQARIVEEFERVKKDGRLFAGGGTMTGHLNCFPGAQSRFAYEALEKRGIIDFIRTIAPQSVRPPNVGCNLNLPGSIKQHYHVDRPFTFEFIIANVAAVDTEIANGAIDVLPGTHRQFYPYWKFALGRTWRRTTRLPLKQGDVLVRSSNLWHRGMPNLTTKPRLMLAFTWEDGGSVLEDPWTHERGAVAFYPNWFRTSWLGRLRERTFITAPITYETYRFVRSLIGKKGYSH
jgi:Phytanoyl-CoA dioxygenase (PhyH)